MPIYSTLSDTSLFDLTGVEATYAVLRGDDNSVTQALTGQHTFVFGGQPYSTVYISTNGLVNFTQTQSNTTASTSANSNVVGFMIPQGDIVPGSSPLGVYYKEFTDTYVVVYNCYWYNVSSTVYQVMITINLSNHASPGNFRYDFGTIEDNVRVTAIGYSFGSGNATDFDTNADLTVDTEYTSPASPFQTITNTQSQFSNKALIFSSTGGSDVNCFGPGTEILCQVDGSDVYLPLEEIHTGETLVKTADDGYKRIYAIMHRSAKPSSSKVQNRLFRCSHVQYPERVTRDLILTGGHSVLVDELSDDQKLRMAAVYGNDRIFITGSRIGKYRLLACADDHFEEIPAAEITGDMKNVWHVVLENESEFANYGIYANGMIVESCSEYSMKL